MINQEHIFQKGKFKEYEKYSKLFLKDEPVGDNAIFFIKKGQVQLKIFKKDKTRISIPLKEGDIVGIPEVYTGSNRITEAVCESPVECYVWSESEFLSASSVIWELSLYTIRSLSSVLKTIDAEFIEEINIEVHNQ